MRIWQRIKEVFASSLARPDRWLVNALGGEKSKSGQDVTPENAMQCAAVYASVRVIAESVAQLPLILYKRTPDGGKVRAVEHPLYAKLAVKPNGWQTSFEYREAQQVNLALRGNAYSFINRVGRSVHELIPIHPDRVEVEQLDDFTVQYIVKTGEKKNVIPASEMHHVRGLSTNGITGISPIRMAREAIGLSLATEEHGARLFQNAARPGGIITRPADAPIWSEEAAKNFLRSFREAYSGENLSRTAMLEDGMAFQVVGMTSEDAQFLETRKYQRTEIASIFRVPPHMIGDLERATFSNIEHQSLEFVMHSLMPWLRRWEQAISRDLLTEKERETYFAEFLVDGLLRGDIATRYAAYNTAILTGWMNRNEARLKENMNPEEGLSVFLEPLNMTSAGEKPAITPDQKAA